MGLTVHVTLMAVELTATAFRALTLSRTVGSEENKHRHHRNSISSRLNYELITGK